MRAAIIAILILSGLMQSTATAAEIPAEIDYLLKTMGNSDCTFTRNGKEYDAKDAEAMTAWRVENSIFSEPGRFSIVDSKNIRPPARYASQTSVR